MSIASIRFLLTCEYSSCKNSLNYFGEPASQRGIVTVEILESMKMTDDEMRVAIAEACGFKPHRTTPPPYGEFYEKILWSYEDRVGIRFARLPDYLNDLNAIHAAEATLPKEQLWYLTAVLASAVDPEVPIAHASARERCIAFIEVISDPVT
jgi:hypothetical protein